MYDISVADVEHYILENGAVSHNTGVYYSADTIWIVGRQQEKDGTDLTGFNFVINVEKSRFVKEKSKIPISVNRETGLNVYSGLLDIALEGQFVIKPKNARYQRVDPETGEIEDKIYKEVETNNKLFWEPILKSDRFKHYIEETYKVSGNILIQSENEQLLDE